MSPLRRVFPADYLFVRLDANTSCSLLSKCPHTKYTQQSTVASRQSPANDEAVSTSKGALLSRVADALSDLLTKAPTSQAIGDPTPASPEYPSTRIAQEGRPSRSEASSCSPKCTWWCPPPQASNQRVPPAVVSTTSHLKPACLTRITPVVSTTSTSPFPYLTNRSPVSQ